jgi:hypothetical protein
MTTTRFGYCSECDQRRELVMTSPGAFACHSCGNVDVYESKAAFDDARREAA